MNKVEFTLGIAKLYESFYPDKFYDVKPHIEAIAESWYQDFKGVSFDKFSKAISKIIVIEKKFPIKSTLWNYIKQEKEEVKDLIACDECEKTGYYTVWKFSETYNKYYPFAYRCNCPAGRALNMLPITEKPTRAHNPFPPDNAWHKEFNRRTRM